jgi:hypothetical protein
VTASNPAHSIIARLPFGSYSSCQTCHWTASSNAPSHTAPLTPSTHADHTDGAPHHQVGPSSSTAGSSLNARTLWTFFTGLAGMRRLCAPTGLTRCVSIRPNRRREFIRWRRWATYSHAQSAYISGSGRMLLWRQFCGIL